MLNFEHEAKRLIKKYPSLKAEIRELGNSLSENPQQGDSIGKNCYKVRLSIASKGKGKSGGARVITCVYFAATTVFLLSIFDKSEKSNITERELQQLLKEIK
ncbi:MAG: type II toxin-antitoxin system RelE/ParE family toxin [Bacteroidia bacterium]